jgi:hypothetical protein
MSNNKTESVKPPVPTEAAVAEPRRAYIRAAHGDMVHVFTNAPITSTPVKMDIDFWLEAQLKAGKVIEGED